jgi:hypothetical protein
MIPKRMAKEIVTVKRQTARRFEAGTIGRVIELERD